MDKKTLFLIATSQGDDVVKISKALWEKFCEDCEIIVMSAEKYKAALIDYIADENAPEQAAFVPVLTIPVSPINYGDLEVLKSFVINDERKKEIVKAKTIAKNIAQVRYYIPQELPNVYNKIKLAQMISELKVANKEVNISTVYGAVARPDNVPFDASVANSNITGLVARSNPDMNIVARYMVDRKFIVTNNEGFAAISSELEKLLEV